MAHQIAPDPLVDPGSQHPILEVVAKPIQRVVIALAQAILAQILVDGGAQRRRTVAVSRKAFREILDRGQRDPEQGDLAFGVGRLKLPSDGCEGEMRNLVVQLDLLGPKRCEFTRPSPGIDHRPQDRARAFLDAHDTSEWLFLNVDPYVAIEGPRYGSFFAHMLHENGLAPHRVAVELIESFSCDRDPTRYEDGRPMLLRARFLFFRFWLPVRVAGAQTLHRAVAPPIYQTATFAQEAVGRPRGGWVSDDLLIIAGSCGIIAICGAGASSMSYDERSTRATNAASATTLPSSSWSSLIHAPHASFGSTFPPTSCNDAGTRGSGRTRGTRVACSRRAAT